MSKKLFLKVGLLLLSLSFVSCGNDSNSLGEDTSSNASTSQAVINAEISEEESIINTSPSVETAVESELEDENVKQSLTEEEYYLLIKEAKQRQQDYIDSIDDPKVKQSVQTSYSAAIAESSFLYIKYPEDTKTIDAALKRVLNGE